MTQRIHDTEGMPAEARAEHWTRVIAAAYFPLDLSFADPDRFAGRLELQEVGPVSLSRLRTAPVSYERHRRHIAAATAEQYLITLPRRAPVEFRQLGREVRCDPGGILLERGDEPYRFAYARANDLCVLKVDRARLAERLRAPDRFCARAIDGRSGMAALFAAMARQTLAADPAPGAEAEVLGRHLIELLALALDRRAEVEGGGDGSAVRAAHLARAEEVIARNLANPALSPGFVAEACGISLRYLHALFADRETTVAGAIRTARLRAARDLLAMPHPGPLADVAYRFGFPDQAQFSRQFRAQFGVTPSAYRAALRAGERRGEPPAAQPGRPPRRRRSQGSGQPGSTRPVG